MEQEQEPATGIGSLRTPSIIENIGRESGESLLLDDVGPVLVSNDVHSRQANCVGPLPPPPSTLSDDHGDALHSAANRMLVLRGSE